MASLFNDAKLKIKRANEHIQQLYTLLHGFLKGDFCKFSIEHNTDTGSYFLKLKHTKLLPDAVPLLIGDSIHNLRAALDYN